ncbi:MAG: Stp1/IreP family PP2C-type Ser/Thr phosphatase [Oscillospiraceae bacterium]|nr:Stp1/IreP family PP2C-type Ser/Thr phosphatase [Oscillospiraceae bacterium]
MDAWGITDNGKVRKTNQDVFKIHLDEQKGIAIVVVCDGMGGAAAGNIASKLACETFFEHVRDYLNDDAQLDDISEIAANASASANTAVFNKGMNNDEYSGMGTTLTALISSKNGEAVANIGDSRAYHISESGIAQITKDHSIVEEMIDRGEIERSEAHLNPKKNLITRAIGASPYEQTDVFTQNIDTGDLIVLCTDGLSNLVMEDEILSLLKNSADLRSGCTALIDEALSRGAPDNVTVAVFRK